MLLFSESRKASRRLYEVQLSNWSSNSSLASVMPIATFFLQLAVLYWLCWYEYTGNSNDLSPFFSIVRFANLNWQYRSELCSDSIPIYVRIPQDVTRRSCVHQGGVPEMQLPQSRMFFHMSSHSHFCTYVMCRWLVRRNIEGTFSSFHWSAAISEILVFNFGRGKSREHEARRSSKVRSQLPQANFASFWIPSAIGCTSLNIPASAQNNNNNHNYCIHIPSHPIASHRNKYTFAFPDTTSIQAVFHAYPKWSSPRYIRRLCRSSFLWSGKLQPFHISSWRRWSRKWLASSTRLAWMRQN